MFEMMQIQLYEQVIEVVFGVLAVLLSWVTGEAILCIRKRRHEGYVRDAGERLIQAAELVVSRGMQIQAKRLKEAASDGKLTEEEGEALLAQATDDVLSYLGKSALKDMERVIEPEAVRKMAQDAIETQVIKWKAGLK